MTLLVALLASTLFLSNAMKKEYLTLIDSYPDIVVVNQKAMKDITFKEADINKLISINGVSRVVGRVNGDYKFRKTEALFHVVGIDEFETYSNPLIEHLNKTNSLSNDAMIVSQNVANILKSSYYKEYFNFIKEDSSFKKVYISKTFDDKKAIILL